MEADEALAKLLLEEEKVAEEKRREKDEQDNSCTICYEHLFSQSKNGPAHLKNCNCVLHLDCVRPHIQAQLERNLLEFTCPNADCTKLISPSDLKYILSSEELNRYNRLCVSRAVDGNSEMSWCLTPGCNYAFVKDNQPKFSCPLCFKNYCIECKVEYHQGKSCAEYKAENFDPNADPDEVKKFKNELKLKQCRQCQRWIEKNHGCNHMTCFCGAEFCWLCGANYEPRECECEQFDSDYYGSEDLNNSNDDLDYGQE